MKWFVPALLVQGLIWSAPFAAQAESETVLVLRSTEHSERVTKTVFSPNEQYLATASVDNTIKILDPESGREVLIVQHPGAVLDIDFSPDSQFIASATLAPTPVNEVVVTDIAQKRIVHRFTSRETFRAVRYSPCGQYLALVAYKKLQLYHAQTFQLIETLEGIYFDDLIGEKPVLQFSRVGSLLAFAGERDLKVYNLRTRELITHELPARPLTLDFSSNGRMLVHTSLTPFEPGSSIYYNDLRVTEVGGQTSYLFGYNAKNQRILGATFHSSSEGDLILVTPSRGSVFLTRPLGNGLATRVYEDTELSHGAAQLGVSFLLAHSDEEVKVMVPRSVNTTLVQSFECDRAEAGSVAFSPRRNYYIATCSDKTVKWARLPYNVWELRPQGVRFTLSTTGFDKLEMFYYGAKLGEYSGWASEVASKLAQYKKDLFYALSKRGYIQFSLEDGLPLLEDSMSMEDKDQPLPDELERFYDCFYELEHGKYGETLNERTILASRLSVYESLLAFPGLNQLNIEVDGEPYLSFHVKAELESVEELANVINYYLRDLSSRGARLTLAPWKLKPRRNGGTPFNHAYDLATVFDLFADHIVIDPATVSFKVNGTSIQLFFDESFIADFEVGAEKVPERLAAWQDEIRAFEQAGKAIRFRPYFLINRNQSEIRSYEVTESFRGLND